MRSKNLAILATILILGGVLLVLASYYFEVDPLNQVACQEDARVCPDGSTVVRGGPNCEFTPCPEVLPAETEQRDLREMIMINVGAPIDSQNAETLMETFPGLWEGDFDGVETVEGFYIYLHGGLSAETSGGAVITGADTRLTEAGLDRLIDNVTWRMGFNDYRDAPPEEVVGLMLAKQPETPALPSEPEDPDEPVPFEPVACTMDAKMCPDGSFVGRIGPDCEFAPCPDSKWPIRYGEDVSRMEEYRLDCEQRNGIFNECDSACGPLAEICMSVCSMTCTGPADEHVPPVPAETNFCPPESRGVDACIEIYQPVCGQVEVQCITTPCDPVPETFSNSCFACMNKNVIGYTEGSCEGIEVY